MGQANQRPQISINDEHSTYSISLRKAGDSLPIVKRLRLVVRQDVSSQLPSQSTSLNAKIRYGKKSALYRLNENISFNYKQWRFQNCVTRKKSTNVYKRCPNIISIEKWQILTPLQKLPKNVGDLGKLIVAKGFKNLAKGFKTFPKSNKSPDLLTLTTRYLNLS